MKKLFSCAIITTVFFTFSQEVEPKNSASFKPGEGFTFHLINGDYQFQMGGFIQPNILLSKSEQSELETRLNVGRAFFMLGGKAAKQKISFLLQSDFSMSSPLMDAWIAYHPYNWLTISAGQKQNFVNSREMLYREDRLQFTDRSRNNQIFNKTGREFGLFIETKFGKKIGFAPKLSLTSGDGRNSFGVDSRDTDLGGFKLGGRLDLYPLGFFSEGNDLFTADLKREQTMKLLIGSAASRNFGASDAVGEGHGVFLMYNAAGKIQLPNYNKFVADVLMKYKGFSMLIEYTNATATGLDLLFTDDLGSTILAPTQISQFLILGTGITGQLGYVTKKGYSFDLRYDLTKPEFKQNANSLLNESATYTVGLSKYFDQNNVKVQASMSQTHFPIGPRVLGGMLMVQVAF